MLVGSRRKWKSELLDRTGNLSFRTERCRRRRPQPPDADLPTDTNAAAVRGGLPRNQGDPVNDDIAHGAIVANSVSSQDWDIHDKYGTKSPIRHTHVRARSSRVAQPEVTLHSAVSTEAKQRWGIALT